VTVNNDDTLAVDTGRLLVVGAGAMGQQIAVQAALNRIEVALVDVSGERIAAAGRAIDDLLQHRVDKGRIGDSDAGAAKGRLALSSDLKFAAAESDWVIEAVVELVDVKRRVFADLAVFTPPSAGLTTNSSHIRAATIAGDAPWAPRCLNMHFFHPVLVMDLIEVVPSPTTDRRYVIAAEQWARRMSRTPVVLAKDLDGFLVNRILGEASREAFALLADGVASFADIDIAVTRGLRWPLGPFQLADLSGLDVLHNSRKARYELHGDPADRQTVEILEPLVADGRLGRKTERGFYDYSTSPATPLTLPTLGGDAAALQ
jgi:3-hydroxybutyryl-CoA dehydrogenase